MTFFKKKKKNINRTTILVFPSFFFFLFSIKGEEMKFSKYLEGQSVPEWRKAYINYKGLKKKLKQVERVSKKKKREKKMILIF